MVEKERSEKLETSPEEAAQETFSANVIHHAMQPTHFGKMDKPDGHALVQGTCGDTDEFSVKIFSGRIREIRFRTTGCFFTIACCDAAASLAEGRTVREGMRISGEAVLEYLGGLPQDHEHCALLAATTLHKALLSYVIRGIGL